MELFNKIRTIGRLARCLPISIFFNLKQLPLRQAIHLPILLYKPKLLVTNGKVAIKGGVNFGIIKLGFPCSSLYPNGGITIKNRGTIVFEGSCSVANNSSIEVGPTGRLTFGDRFITTAQTRIGCHREISFGRDVIVSWDCLFVDTDYHALTTECGKVKACSPIKIGSNNWICAQSLVLKGSSTPDYCTLAARSMLNTDYSSSKEKILLAGNPAKIVKTNIWRNPNDDSIDYDKEDNV